MARHRIELARAGDDVAITFLSATDGARHTQRITTQDAFNLGLVMSDERPKQAVNFATKSGVEVQIENRPYDRAWLTIPMVEGNDLIVQVERHVIDDLGRNFWMLSRPGRDQASTGSGRAVVTHRVSGFYLASDLDEEDPPGDDDHLL